MIKDHTHRGPYKGSHSFALQLTHKKHSNGNDNHTLQNTPDLSNTVDSVFGWVLRCTNKLNITHQISSFTNGGRSQVPLRALFQARAGT